MDITQATGGAAGTVALPATQSAQSTISSDFETFLRMLTVQLENQDPLNPMESSEFAMQLATFSGVEQAVLTNDLLKDLTAQFGGGGLASMAAWVGKEARAPGAVNFDGSPITLYPDTAQSADRAQMVVTNATGSEVQRFDIGLGSDPVEWAGVGPSGNPLPPGVYRFEVVSSVGETELSREDAEAYSTVTEVQLIDGQATLVLTGGVTVASDSVTALRDPGA